jgi:hypothetical protein
MTRNCLLKKVLCIFGVMLSTWPVTDDNEEERIKGKSKNDILFCFLTFKLFGVHQNRG